jgi:hypothetical protein
MPVAWPDSDQPVEGYRIGWSFKSRATVLFCALMLVLLGGAMVWACSTVLTMAGPGFSLFGWIHGVLAFGFGLLLTPVGISGLFRQRDLVLGADRLQILGNEGTVLMQVPYKNIARAGIVKRRYGKYIAVEFFNPRDPSTLNAGQDETDADGWHSLLIDNSWSVPLEYIYARLYAALQAHPERDRFVQALPDRSPPGSASDEIAESLRRERQI